MFNLWGLAEKFVDWPRHSAEVWPNKVYFSAYSLCSPHISFICVAVLGSHLSKSNQQ